MIDLNQVQNRGVTLLVVVVILALSIVALGSSAVGVSTATSHTITVDNGGGADYTSIQAAVDNANSGDTIEVQPGTYHESVIIDKTVTIVAPNGATLDGSTLSGSQDGIIIQGQAAPEIVGLTIIEYSSGVSAQASTGDWTLRNVTIRDSSFGAIRAQDSTGDWTIEDSIINDEQNDAVDAANTAGDWTIRDSTLTSRVYAEATTGQWTIEGVTIENTAYAASIAARNSDNAWTVRDTTLRNPATVGIDATDSAGAWTVETTTILNASESGVNARSSSGDWTIRESTIRNSTATGVDASNANGVWAVTESVIVNNGGGVVSGTQAGTALNNWWGACDGPSGEYSGSGDAVIGDIAVEPYYTDAAQTTLSSETSTPCSASSPFDFGVELEQSNSVAQGNDVNITAYPYNNADQPISDTTLELFVDADDDGQFESDEVATSRTLDFDAGEYRTLNLTYTNVQLAPGEYSYMAQIRKDGQTTRSFTNGTLTVQSSGSTVDRTLDSTQVQPGETTQVTVEVQLDQQPTDLQVTENFDPAFANVEIVDGDGATVATATNAGDQVTASWGDTGQVTLIYEVTVPQNASDGDTFTIDGSVTADGQTSSIDSENVTVSTEPTIAQYTEPDGTVGPSGIGDAAADFRNGEISPGLLGDVASAFRSGESVA